MDHLCFLRLVFLMLSRLFIAASWSPAGTAGLLALVGYVYCIFFPFPCCIQGRVWYLIVSMVSFPDLCCLSYFVKIISLIAKYKHQTGSHDNNCIVMCM